MIEDELADSAPFDLESSFTAKLEAADPLSILERQKLPDFADSATNPSFTGREPL